MHILILRAYFVLHFNKMANNYFVIIGTKDNPIYEAEFGNIFKDGQSTRKEDLKHLNQFVIHSALDIVDEVVWGTQSNYLKIVDRYQMFSDDFCLFSTMDLVIIRAVIIRAIDMIVVWVMDALVSCVIDLLVCYRLDSCVIDLIVVL